MKNYTIIKVIFIGTRGVPANYGGFETYVEQIGIELAELGCMVTVINPSNRKIDGNLFGKINIKYALNLERYFKNRYIRAFTTIIYDAHALIHATFSDYNIIIVCGYGAGPFLFIPRLFGRKVIINPDGFEWKSSRWGYFTILWLKICEYIAAKWTSGMIADSQEIGRYFTNKFKISPAVIEYGAKIISELPIPEILDSIDDYYLACARMVPETNIDLIISGFLLSKTKSNLIIVGPITDTKYFSEKILPQIDNKKVIYIGSIYNLGVLPAIRYNAKALLHGHASDGTNPSLIESMGAGSIVLAIDRPSNRYPLTEKYNCFFKNAEDLACKINELELLSELSKSEIKSCNKRRIEENFSWKEVAIKHINFFQKINNEI